MFAEYKEYRNQNKVIQYLDIIAYPDGYIEEKIPQPVFSRWALNRKSSGNLDKGAMVSSGLKVIGDSFLAVLSLAGGGGGAASLAGASNEIGNMVGTVGKSNMWAIGVAADSFASFEENYWEYYYSLMTFESALGNLGEQHIGKTDGDGCLGHWFYENGDYFEGFHYNNGVRQGIFVFADGSRYYGVMDNNGLKVDKGIEIAPDGSRMMGNFVNGQLEVGVYENDKCAFVGQWSNGVLHGTGAARFADNTAFMGEWSNGKPVK
ncbi:MAG: hypothetical protein NC394_09585 [Bacteroides sp.]|nr:hypothetical protein [Bacteroides sp.]